MAASQPRNAAALHRRLRGLQREASAETALAFYDALAPVAVAEMFGFWKGSELPTGHPFDGILEALGWHGKRFDDAEAAHPLVFTAPGGGLLRVDPAFVPLPLLRRFAGELRRPLPAALLRRLLPLLGTAGPAARLRMTEYRGVCTAAMCYDALPIHDVFRKIDGDTLLGAMDMRGSDRPFLFVLRRATVPER